MASPDASDDGVFPPPPQKRPSRRGASPGASDDAASPPPQKTTLTWRGLTWCIRRLRPPPRPPQRAGWAASGRLCGTTAAAALPGGCGSSSGPLPRGTAGTRSRPGVARWLQASGWRAATRQGVQARQRR
eukprot:359100-Chlamydomonas_euryale.AAC.2